MRSKKTFEEAKKEISEKYSYLELLEFNGNSNNALFLDHDYGEFRKIYRNVNRGSSGHPIRGKLNKKNKQKKTNLKKYGVEHPTQNKNFYKKIKQTNLNRYGVENPNQLKEIKNKIKETNLNKYGVTCALLHKETKEKIKQTNLKKYGVENTQQNKQIREKSIQTNLKKYGVENPFSNKDIKEKIKKSNLERYGVENPFSNKDIKEKIKKTNLEKYGVEYISQSKEIQEKIKKTNLKKYGVEHNQQNIKIKEKTIQTNIKNGLYFNINGVSFKKYHKNSKLNKFKYETVLLNFNKYGTKALEEKHYNKLHGKSKSANLWLENIEKELGYELIREYHIPTTMYRADGYDSKTNTIYEFYGDYWHGYPDPEKYSGINKILNNSFNTLFYKTIEREQKLEEFGYNVIYIWENDFCV